MIDLSDLREQVIHDVGLSLGDDPTAWPLEDATTWHDVNRATREAATENLRSALARQIGPLAEEIATEIDVAVFEDGPLADTDAIWNARVTGLPVDLSGAVAAPDWEARVEAVKEAIKPAIARLHVTLNAGQLLDLVRKDTRLRHLHGSETLPGFADGVMVETPKVVEPDDVPGQAVDTAGLWDDDEPAATPAPVQQPEPKTRKPRHKGREDRPVAVTEFLDALAAAGITDTRVSEAMGIGKAYFSQIKSGLRPWPGLDGVTLGQVSGLIREVKAQLNRAEALADHPDVVEPSPVV